MVEDMLDPGDIGSLETVLDKAGEPWVDLALLLITMLVMAILCTGLAIRGPGADEAFTGDNEVVRCSIACFLLILLHSASLLFKEVKEAALLLRGYLGLGCLAP